MMASCSRQHAKEPKWESTTGPNWLELPRDVIAKILQMLSAIEIVTSARQVCPLWWNICRDPLMWRTIDMHNLGTSPYDLAKICMYAIDRSCGRVEDINIEYFGTDELLKYLADRTSNLRRIRLSHCRAISDKGLSDVANKFPLLEELDISFNSTLSKDSLEAIGQSCPLLKTLKFNRAYKGITCRAYRGIKSDDDAFAIAKNMHELRYLQLWGNKLTNDGLLAILDGCPYLEFLDLRFCFNVDLRGRLGKRCLDQIKDLKLPNDYLAENANDDDDDMYEFYCECGVSGNNSIVKWKTVMDYNKFK